MPKPIDRRISETIDVMRDELVAITQDLIRFRTLRFTGGDFEICANYLLERLQRCGFDGEVIRVPAEEAVPLEAERSHYRALGLVGPLAPRYNVIAFRRGSGSAKSLHLNGHYCVVEPPAGWSGDPFEPRVEGGRIIGRGACDMKSGLAMIVGAMTALHRLSVSPAGDVYVSFTVDTHLSGDLGAGYIVKRGLGRAARVIIGDTSGVGHVIRGYRGQLWVQIETRGSQTHGATPFYGHNAVEDMAHVMRRLLELKDRIAGLTSAEDIVPYDARHPTLVIGSRIEGGTTTNLVPPSCMLRLDRRLIPEETLDDAIKQIEQAVQAAKGDAPGLDARVHVLFGAPPVVTPADDELVEDLLRNIHRVLDRPGTSFVHPAFLDFQWFASHWHVPVAVYGPGDGGVGTGFRRKPYAEPGEFVLVDDLVNATKVLTATALDLTQ